MRIEKLFRILDDYLGAFVWRLEATIEAMLVEISIRSQGDWTLFEEIESVSWKKSTLKKLGSALEALIERFFEGLKT